MDRKTSTLIAAGTFALAIGIGAAMQYWPVSQPAQATSITPTPVADVSDVQEVSSTPKPPVALDSNVASILPVTLASVSVPASSEQPILTPNPSKKNDIARACEANLNASPAAGAMIAVQLNAPCHGNERVTFHHHGLMFTELVGPDGMLRLKLPALAEQAVVVASFLDGGGAAAQTKVSSLEFYERVVVQWRGNAGLQLHAREFDAEYFSDGHVWRGSETNPTQAIEIGSGFLTSLGQANAPDALMAEVYTFPSGTADAAGTVALTVEAEIHQMNCDTVVEAQTLEIRNGRPLRAKEVTIDVPNCEAVGDFLMLKNIVEDLTIAAN